jgi:hypothetical protein
MDAVSETSQMFVKSLKPSLGVGPFGSFCGQNCRKSLKILTKNQLVIESNSECSRNGCSCGLKINEVSQPKRPTPPKRPAPTRPQRPARAQPSNGNRCREFRNQG